MKDDIDSLIRYFVINNQNYPSILANVLRKLYDIRPWDYYEDRIFSSCGFRYGNMRVSFLYHRVFGRHIFWFENIKMKINIGESEFSFDRRVSLFFYYYFSVAYRHYKNTVSIDTYQKMDKDINNFLKTEI